MPALLFDSDEPAVLLGPALAGCRIATYADIVTPQIVAESGGRLIVIDRGMGDPLNLATVADVERGALDMAAGVAKVRQWNQEHRPSPTLYCDRSNWPAAVEQTRGLVCWHWIATLDGTASPNGQRPAVVQVLGEAQLGFHADLSVIWNDAWHVTPATPTPAELAHVRTLMPIVNQAVLGLSAAVGQL